MARQCSHSIALFFCDKADKSCRFFKTQLRYLLGKCLLFTKVFAIIYYIKNGLDIESKPFLALFVFCSGAVPSYSTHSQNTKFISLSQHSLSCYSLLSSAKLTLFQHSPACYFLILSTKQKQ